MPLPQEHFKVFISHATVADRVLVNWIADALDRLHIRAYVYERYQRGGQNRFEMIKTMIKECPHFLVLLTKEGIASQWVNQEIGYAVALGKDLIPIVAVDSQTGRPIQSSGFVELHDPILYYENGSVELIAQILYTFNCILAGQNAWKDTIFLSCKCGREFDPPLEFAKWWEQWLSSGKPFQVVWTCENCHRQIGISFPDCHLLPQTD
jgi:hypothetical protein